VQRQSFDHPAQQIALQEMVLADCHAVERVARLTAGIEELVPDWELGPVAETLQTLRGVAVIRAVTFMSGIGDVRRFENPRKLMADLGLVPREYSTGQTTKRGGTTKAGNSRVRRTLVEGAWTYRFPAKIGERKLYVLQKLPPEIQDIAWRAQSRLTVRYRRLSQRRKKKTVITTAIARELSAFM
jgi:transposase